MRLHPAIIFVLVAAAAREPAAAPEAPPPSADDLLGAIDFAPMREDLDAAMPSAPDQLVAIAVDKSEPNPGRRLRAIRALAQYPGPEAEAALRTIMADLDDALAGTDVLFLRAAIEALAVIGGSEAVPDIAHFLDSQGLDDLVGQDIRASAAKALGTIGALSGAGPLYERLSIEQSRQVRFAITEALRAILGS
jgi:HEAT repeat protein